MNQKTNKIVKNLSIVLFLFIFILFTNNIFGAINETGYEVGNFFDEVKSVFSYVLGIATGPLTAALASLVNVVLLVIFAVLYLIFSPVSAGLAFPFPDQIIFNKIPFFDPNFINPSEIDSSPVYLLQTTIGNLYYTTFIIAGAIFVISAMIIGIKLTLSSLASDKAHYKEALTMWLTSLVLLVFAHFIMLGIFTINEKLVEFCSAAVDENISFHLNPVTDLGGLIGSVGSALSSFIDLFTEDNPLSDVGFDLPGYGGMLLYFMIKALTGDLVSSIICGIILGQTCALIVQYLRRLFYCIILGILAPLIIAADVVKKSFSV